MREAFQEATRVESRGAWTRLRGDRVATAGLWLLGLLLVIAVFAPAIALNRPFYLIVPEGAGTGGFGALPTGVSFPWFSALFDRNLFGSKVDLLFNGLLAISPLFCAGLILLRRASWRGRTVLTVVTLVLSGCLAWVLIHGEPDRDYAFRVEQMIADGHDVSVLFPPLPGPQPDIMASYAAPSAEHLCGTDQRGADVLAQLLYGTRISLTIGLVAVSIYISIGVLLGALAGYLRGRVDWIISRLIEVVACFPSFLLVLTLIALIRERSIFHVMLVIGVTGWPTVARLVRAEFLRQADLEYTTAARALGFSRWRIIFRHLLPNAMAPVLVTAAFGVAGAILVESGLSFLNLGDTSVSSWGQVLRAGRETGELHLILAPGLLIFVTVTMMNVVAEGLRDALDPRLREI